MNYQLSDPILDGLPEHLHNKNIHTVSCKHLLPSGGLNDPRPKIKNTLKRDPLELPVPNFDIDENCVAESDSFQQDRKQNSTNLDLDTRIGLLIKSKVLAGVHPIFSELDESTSDSDDQFLREISSTDKFRQTKKLRSASLPKDESCAKSFDDSEKPLSRPPSPFLSSATYLFWFNKAIELKQQAKAQEKALLEKAAKRLIHEHETSTKINKTDYSYHEEENYMKHLLNEVSKKFKEIVKQEFINEILDNTIISAFETWWEEEKHQEINSRKAIRKCNTNGESKENLRSVRAIDVNKSFPVFGIPVDFGSDKNNIDAITIEQTFDDLELSKKMSNLKQDNIVSHNYLGNTKNQNNEESLHSLKVQSDIDFKRNMTGDSSFFNVYQSTDHITNISIGNQINTSYHNKMLNINPSDLIVNATESVENDSEVAKNVLNSIVDRITMETSADIS